MNKAYITTAIPYLNGEPHVGHAMDFLLADIYARYLKSQDVDVKLQIGADEHGQKIANKAAELGIDTQEFVDQNWASFKAFIDRLNRSYTDIVRTTDADHKRRTQEIWKKLENHIYKSTYEGWYCEGCEAFVTQTEYEETKKTCPDHQNPYIKLTEENYYLRISEFKDRMTEAIESNQLQIIPEFRKREFLNLLKDMPDVSISRPKSQLQWGIEVPDDDTQVMYVWVDALSNYLTVIGYPENDDYKDWWPADVQVIGKDILRFHAGIWPAMLLGLGLELPKRILTHGHITLNGEKMSKSLGNVVGPTEIMDKYGVEAFRYYFSRHVDTVNDSDFTWDKMHNAYNGELKNDLGNLISRLATMCAKYEVGKPSAFVAYPPLNEYREYMDNFQFSSAIDLAWSQIQHLNQEIDSKKPWALAKENKTDELRSTLEDLINGILLAAAMLRPFLPETVEKIESIFDQSTITPPDSPLFPPIEA